MDSLPVDKMDCGRLRGVAERMRRMRTQHIDWLNRTYRKVVCQLPMTEDEVAALTNTHVCEVGRTLDSVDVPELRRTEAFQEIQRLHEHLHQAAARMAAAYHAQGRVPEAVFDDYVEIQQGFFRVLDDFLWELENLCGKFDALTLLPNRQLLDQILTRELNRATRHQLPLSVVMVDLDHFKQLNDALGHLAGDEVLRQVSAILRARLRDYDVVGRYGGEEFLIILPETTASEAEQLMESLRQALEQAAFGGACAPVTASFGVAQNRPGDRPVDLVGRADVALYVAKESGRNCVRVSRPVQRD